MHRPVTAVPTGGVRPVEDEDDEVSRTAAQIGSTRFFDDNNEEESPSAVTPHTYAYEDNEEFPYDESYFYELEEDPSDLPNKLRYLKLEYETDNFLRYMAKHPEHLKYVQSVDFSDDDPRCSVMSIHRFTDALRLLSDQVEELDFNCINGLEPRRERRQDGFDDSAAILDQAEVSFPKLRKFWLGHTAPTTDAFPNVLRRAPAIRDFAFTQAAMVNDRMYRKVSEVLAPNLERLTIHMTFIVDMPEVFQDLASNYENLNSFFLQSTPSKKAYEPMHLKYGSKEAFVAESAASFVRFMSRRGQQLNELALAYYDFLGEDSVYDAIAQYGQNLKMLKIFVSNDLLTPERLEELQRQVREACPGLEKLDISS